MQPGPNEPGKHPLHAAPQGFPKDGKYGGKNGKYGKNGGKNGKYGGKNGKYGGKNGKYGKNGKNGGKNGPEDIEPIMPMVTPVAFLFFLLLSFPDDIRSIRFH